MKSKQTTEKIQKIITDQKELATRLATTLLAVATIGGGTVALSSCDEIELPKNPETSASEVTTEIPSEQATNDLTTTDEITFDTTEEVTTEAVTEPIEINYHDELIKIANHEDPDYYEFGIMHLIVGETSCKLLARGSENAKYCKAFETASTLIISPELSQYLLDNYIDYTDMAYTNYGTLISLKNRSEEEKNELFKLLYEDYQKSNTMENSLIQ